jgi:hypothetical protein
MWVVAARSAVLSVITGGGKWVEIVTHADPPYQHLIEFWRCVETGFGDGDMRSALCLLLNSFLHRFPLWKYPSEGELLPGISSRRDPLVYR